MTQEDKNLLLQDLCGRLPYGVVIQEKCLEHDETFLPCAEDNKVVNIDVHEDLVITSGGSRYYIEDIKPYLFPLSSMTEEQKRKYNSLRNFVPTYHYEYGDIVEDTELYDNWESIDYLIANHFDYRGLIEMGLAIDATGLNIYINHDTGR